MSALLPAASRAAVVGARVLAARPSAANSATLRAAAVRRDGAHRARLFCASAAVKEPEVAAKAGTDAPTPTLAWKAAIDFKRIKENPDAIQANADKRAAPCDVAKVVSTYDRYQALNRQCDEIREKRNANAKSMKGKMEADVRAALVEEGKALKDQLAAIEGDLNALEVCLLYTSPSPRDLSTSRMPSSA